MQVVLMFIKMSAIDKVMFIVWSIGLIGMAVSVFRFIHLTIVTNFLKAKTI